MNVLHVIDALGVGGGAEHSLAAMLPLLRARGIESSVICLKPREGGLQAELRERGFSVEVLPAGSWWERARALRHEVVSRSPDIVHATLFSSCLTARLACVRLGVARIDSLVNTSYDPVRTSRLAVPAWKLRVVRTVDSLTARWLGGYFHAVAPSVAREASDVLGIQPDRVFLVPRGRSRAALGERTVERRLETRRRLDLHPETPVFLNVGRQDGSKGQVTLIRAFERLHHRQPQAVLLIAGREGDETPAIQRAIAQTRLDARTIRVLGHRTDVFDLYVACDIFVFPSLYEGAGGSLIEAMALSTPIIGSDAPGVVEALAGGELGLIVPRSDEESLAQGMASLLEDSERRTELARRGGEYFQRHHELEKVADAMAAMYKRVQADHLG